MLIEREIDEYSCPAHGSPFGAYLEIYQRSAPDAASLGPFGSKRHSERHDSKQVAHRQKQQDHPSHRSEEHTSELQSLMRISYAVFCLKKKKTHSHIQHH